MKTIYRETKANHSETEGNYRQAKENQGRLWETEGNQGNHRKPKETIGFLSLSNDYQKSPKDAGKKL